MLSVRSNRMLNGEFSPISYSLRTTVISLSRSFFAMLLWTMRSASISSAQVTFESVAGSVSK